MTRRARVAVLLFALAACDSTPPRPLVIADDPGQTTWSSISAGGNNACALDADAVTFCWGLHKFCVNLTCHDAVPFRLDAAVPFLMTDVGTTQACALSTALTVFCWGTALGPSLGDGIVKASPIPVPLGFARPVKTVSVGFAHACLLDDEGTAYCWGRGVWALGDGSDSDVERSYSTPRAVATTLKFQSIAAAVTHTCAIAVNQDAYCWGAGRGALGVGPRDEACASGPSCFRSATPEPVFGGLKWKSLAVSSGVTCGVATDDRGYCWGKVGVPADMLGAGVSDGSKAPRPIVGGLLFRSISPSSQHACGITLDGTAYCWGNGNFGQLGTGVQQAGIFNVPQQVVGGLQFLALVARDMTCGISVHHNAYCWGPATAGQLGNGEASDAIRPVPTRVSPPVR